MTGSVVTISTENTDQASEIEYSLLADAPSVHGFQVAIESTLDYEDFILYIVRVSYKFASWSVRRRYKEFAELHSSLCKLYPAAAHNGLASAIPGKKLVGNFREKFVKKRQMKLEDYLRHAMSSVQAIPKELAYFLGNSKFFNSKILHFASCNYIINKQFLLRYA